MTKTRNLIGFENEYFKVLSLSDKQQTYIYGDRTYHKTFWMAECKRCGTIKPVEHSFLLTGKTKSCGCLKKRKAHETQGWRGHGEIPGEYFCSLRGNAEKRKIPFDVTLEYLWQIFLAQNKKCALIGSSLTFNGNLHKKERGTASVDRIDCTKGYVEGNVRWIHKTINNMRGCLSDGQLYHYAELLLQHRNDQSPDSLRTEQ